MTDADNTQTVQTRQDLPTPREVLDAVSIAAREIEQSTGCNIPVIALRERACAILYRGA